VGECPEMALALLRDFAGRLDHLTNLVEDLSLRTVRGRLARFLLEHAPTARLSSPKSDLSGTAEAGAVTQRWTQEEIAVHLGTVRDMVGRTLRAFADAGLIQMNRQRLVLLDREGLEAEARRYSGANGGQQKHVESECCPRSHQSIVGATLFCRIRPGNAKDRRPGCRPAGL